MAPTALQLSPEERIAYPYLFSKADTEQLGVLVGEKAVAFFAHSSLPPTILGEIWQLADSDNAGFLTREQFDIALRLIGKAQNGLPINQQAIASPGPLCRLKGYNIPGLPNSSGPIPARPSNGLSSTPASEPAQDLLYVISNEDKVKYSRMFMNAGPHDGLLDGDKARDIFIRSKLSFEKLGQIWALADTQSRGALSVSDFCIAMHLIQLCMSGRLSTFPTSLPLTLLNSAVAPAPAIPTSAATPPHPISRQVTGQQSLPPGSLSTASPLRPALTGSSIRPQYTGRSASGISSALPTGIAGSLGSPPPSAWDVSAAELAQSNIYFDNLDPNRQGFITGDRAVPFMMESKLPGEVLARIWDLADIRGEGKLNREEFAVAMRLIQDTLASGVETLSAKLPPNMIPPSLRETPALPAIPETSSTQLDLLSLMDDEPPKASQSSQTAEKHTSPPESQATAPLSVPQAALGTQLTGRSITGVNSTSNTGLGEDNGAKLGNLVTQLSSTENALSTIRDERSRLEIETGNTVEQIKALELKLSNARQAYHTEAPLVEELRKKQAEQRSLVSKLTSDLITAESELSSLKIEKEQIEGNILRDKEDVREMKKRTALLEEESQQLKSKLESLKKDSRLQKGLIAIGKKQVATVENQRDDISKEINALAQQVTPLSMQSTGAQGSDSALSGIAPGAPSYKSTNPFERMLSAAPTPSPGSHTIQSPSPSVSSRDLGQSQQGVPTQPGTNLDPFSSDSAQNLTTPSPNTMNFADAFSHENSTENPSLGDHGFHDALESNSPDFVAPGTVKVPTSSAPARTQQHPTKDTEHAIPSSDPDIGQTQKNDNSDDSSSDEDEIEDAVGRHLPLSSRASKPSSVSHDKFPPLEDLEASVESKIVPSSARSQEQAFPEKETEPPALSIVTGTQKPASVTSNSKPASFSNPVNGQPTGLNENATNKDDKNPINFGDDLEVSDFDADFGSAGVKMPASSTMGSALDDFDSAFENLPPPGWKSTTSRQEDNSRSQKTEIGESTNMGFDDAFVPLDHQQKPASGEKNESIGFDESFADFDQNFNKDDHQQPTKPKADDDHDPFEPQPSSSSEPPPLPTRPANSADQKPPQAPTGSDKVEGAKPSDSAAVKEICAMGFDRKVAIEALERDEWDMDRALNHLLGT